MHKKLLSKSLVIGIIVFFIGASIFPIVNTNQMQNGRYKEEFKNQSHASILIQPQPSPIKFGVDFNITFYQQSSLTFRQIIGQGLPILWYIGRFSLIDFSNNPVGRIEYIEQSTGSETEKTFTYFMAGFFFVAVNFSNLHYNETTGIGYITGEGALLFYFGL